MYYYLEEPIFVTGGFDTSSHDESSDGQIVKFRNHGQRPTLLHKVVVELKQDITVSLAGSEFKTEEDPQKLLICSALFVTMPAHYLDVEICDLIQIYVHKIHPNRMATLKKTKMFLEPE